MRYHFRSLWPPFFNHQYAIGSEKARTPSWTDRILYKGERIALVEYTRGEQLLSDHRPVRGIFQVFTKVIDHAERDRLQKSLYAALASGGKLPTAPVKKLEVTKKQAPPLPARRPVPKPPTESPFSSTSALNDSKSKASETTGMLIDLGEDIHSSQSNSLQAVNPFATSTAFDQNVFVSQTQSLPSSTSAPSGSGKWWDKDINESWIPYEGTPKNPFYPLEKPDRSSKAMSAHFPPANGQGMVSAQSINHFSAVMPGGPGVWASVPRSAKDVNVSSVASSLSGMAISSSTTNVTAKSNTNNPFADDPWNPDPHKSLMD